MTDGRSRRPRSTDDWPTFAIRYTFNPGGVGLNGEFETDEVVVFDATRGRPNSRWIAAKRGSYVPLDEIR
ncbi:hypothetical protein [Halalkalicoccus subterraneus]|uniref:hypothetical protein n=1 Tax=Halalkalicoccus subterraneus TaxID=2675002 RepID=UPI000EFA4AF5|nr:hypothetical protein [Halalkalicoccus subterraneus]